MAEPDDSPACRGGDYVAGAGRAAGDPSAPAPGVTRPASSFVLPIALGVISIEVIGLIGYGAAIGLAARGSGGGRVSAAPVLVALYLIFALLLGLVGRGVARGRRSARTPYLLAQSFGLVVAYTLLHGTGLLPHLFAALVGVVAVAGLIVGLSGPFGRNLDR